MTLDEAEMNEQMIPAEAVEAAAIVLWDKEMNAPWSSVADGFKAPFLRDARAALEAAAPHLLKQGWDEGYKAGLFDKEYYSHNRNPYMLNNEGEK